MLIDFRVKNFKSIKNLELAMRPFMLFVGPNGAGKTNIVHAVELLGDILSRGTTDPAREQGWAQIIRRGAKPARGGISLGATMRLPDQVVEYSLPTIGSETKSKDLPKQVRLSIDLRLSGTLRTEQVEIEEEELRFQSSDSSFRLAIKNDNIEIDLGDDERLWKLAAPWFHHAAEAPSTNAEVRDAFAEAFDPSRLAIAEPHRRTLRVLNFPRYAWLWMRPAMAACSAVRLRVDSSALRSDSSYKDLRQGDALGPHGNGLAAAVDRLRGSGEQPKPAFRRVLEELQKVYPRIEDVHGKLVQPGRLALLVKERGIAEELGQASISDGVLHALAILVMLEHSGPGLLAIEEPENAIHPWSARAMIRRAQQKKKRQVLVTTHSETVVNAVEDPSSLFVVENDERRGTTVSPATKKEAALDAILTETDQRLGDLWIDGTLGGVPRGRF